MKCKNVSNQLSFYILIIYTLFFSDSRFPIPDSRFPIPDSQFPIPSTIDNYYIMSKT
ncbi:hypothetical protein [Moorena producens]|uniref:hypothetical protein n=1 Tax=Moorena producens TaxID=1155739 RepID=UPI001314D781|nr:hypothetical protein [Moorena producens]